MKSVHTYTHTHTYIHIHIHTCTHRQTDRQLTVLIFPLPVHTPHNAGPRKYSSSWHLLATFPHWNTDPVISKSTYMCIYSNMSNHSLLMFTQDILTSLTSPHHWHHHIIDIITSFLHHTHWFLHQSMMQKSTNVLFEATTSSRLSGHRWLVSNRQPGQGMRLLNSTINRYTQTC